MFKPNTTILNIFLILFFGLVIIMFKTKYKRVSAINQVAILAMKLNVNFRSSPYGITIIGDNETKCFKATEEQLLQAREFVLKQADPSLQTVLKPFYG